MKPLLTPLIRPEIFAQLRGTTDSEWVYCLFLSQLNDYTQPIALDEAKAALLATLKILKQVREQCDIYEASPLNLFITNGEYLLVTRFVFDYGCNTNLVEKAFLEFHSLWLTFGERYGKFDDVYKMHGANKRNNILVASEPLTTDRTTWIELPEYSLTQAWLEQEQVVFRTQELYI